MMHVGLIHYLAVSGALFALGLACIVLRRNALLVFMGLELNLNAANLALVAFSRYGGHAEGQVLATFIIAIAAAEVAIGLAIIVALFRQRSTVVTDLLRSLRG